MSVGNLKDYGNKGNNFPFQLKVLQGIQELINNIDPDCCNNTVNILNDIRTILQGEGRTPSIISTTGAGATPANIYSMSIANVGSAAGVINGVNIPAGTVLNYDGGFNNTLTQMSYNATGTTFIISYIA